ncbi:MAG: hypothetical protein ACC653_14020 [Gammaproteobacteria bacterium]
MKKYFILSIVIALYASPGYLLSAEKKFMELSDLITANKICKKELAGNDEILVCRYKIDDLVDVEINGVGLGDAVAMINKANRDGDFYVNYNKASKCIVIEPGRKPSNKIKKYTKGKQLLGFAHISLITGNVFDDSRLCEIDGN